ncbi:hypothetical protein Taro_019532 [Colocasia esculenta]|uniref:Uncharacterized protein n=1 Tax=Colocasia esculenta TaxID=4460 RepID=A0A843V5S0_COLES|nr:hypothetical protein [Colocasia esculenta]
MSGSAWDCDRGYVAFLKATYPLPPSGLMDGDMGYVAFLKATWPMSPSHRVAPDAVDTGTGSVDTSGFPRTPSGLFWDSRSTLAQAVSTLVAFPEQNTCTALVVSGERDKMAVAFTFSNSEI